MTRKGKKFSQGRGARLFVVALAVFAALLSSCENIISRTPPADGGGYEPDASAKNGALTVTASVSGGTARHAMPSPDVSEFDYAALLYPGDSKEKGEFAKGTVAADKTISFSFPRPEGTGKLNIEIFAFENGTTAFSEDDAILWGSVSGLDPVVADGILDVGTIMLSVKEGCEALGKVSLKVRVPENCSLEIEISGNDTAKFKYEEDESTSNTYTISHVGDGIAAGSYQLTLKVKKEGLILYVLSEHINVFPGLCTNKWSEPAQEGVRVINEESFSTTVYVRGTDGWYEDSPYASTATADDDNFGSFLAPLATIQKALDKVLAMNAMNDDGSREYTVYVDGTLTNTSSADVVAISSFSKPLNLTIKALSEKGATLNAGKKGRVVNAAGNGELNLKMENLVLRNGKASDNGGGAYLENGTFVMRGCEITGNSAGYGGGGIFIAEGDTTLTMTDCKVDGNEAQYGGGIFVDEATLTIEGGTVNTNNATDGGGIYVAAGTLTMESGNIEIKSNVAQNLGGGVLVRSESMFTITTDIEISYNIATNANGGGVYVSDDSGFRMGDNTRAYKTIISHNTALNGDGGGVYVTGSQFVMQNSASLDSNEAQYGGGVYVKDGEFWGLNGNYGAPSIINNTAKGKNGDGGGGGLYLNESTASFRPCIIQDNTAEGTSETSGGGGIYLYNKSKINGNSSSGAYIITNTAKSGNGAGVFVNPDCEYDVGRIDFTEDDDDVYLYVYQIPVDIPTIRVVYMTDLKSYTLTVKPSSYVSGREVLSAGDGITITQDVCKRFILTDENYEIVPDSTGKYGVLKLK